PRLRAAHSAVPRPARRARTQDRLHTGGGVQPRGVGVAQRRAVRHDRARLAHPRAIVPRRQEAPAVRLRGSRHRSRARAEATHAEEARPRAPHDARAVSPTSPPARVRTGTDDAGAPGRRALVRASNAWDVAGAKAFGYPPALRWPPGGKSRGGPPGASRL